MAKARAENRKSKRVKMKTKVPVRLVNGHTEESQAVTRDISLRGVFIHMQNRVAQGSTLEVVLPLPSELNQGADVWVRCKCRVVRVEEVPESQEYGVAATIEDFETVQEAIVPDA